MKPIKSEIILGFLLIILAIFTYYIHFIFFHDLHHIFLYLIGDIGFMFLEILIVTLIIHKLLSEYEKRKQFGKMNMVIGIFFSEVGTPLLKTFSASYISDTINQAVADKSLWSGKNYRSTLAKIITVQFSVDISQIDLPRLKSFLKDRHDFLLRLLENPILIEHENFTELLRAVFHLTEELEHRESLDTLPETDIQHLAGDCNRAYNLLVREWFGYMNYLHGSYPYLFSLATRLNPFDKAASPIVR